MADIFILVVYLMHLHKEWPHIPSAVLINLYKHMLCLTGIVHYLFDDFLFSLSVCADITIKRIWDIVQVFNCFF